MSNRKKNEIKKVSDPIELSKHLIWRAERMDGTNDGQDLYIYHYTTLEAVEGILKSKQWFINSPKNMNDGLELEYLEGTTVDNIFFGSFLTEDEESIAMWRMYAQPWAKGVMIKIPIQKMKAWLRGKLSIFSADVKKHKALKKLDNAKLTFHLIAYTDVEPNNTIEQTKLKCIKQEIVHPGNVYNFRELAGYVKDNAWSYEKEFRLKVEVPADEKCEAVMVEIPEDILNSFEFVTGPRFEGDLVLKIKEINPDFDLNEFEFEQSNRVEKSLFYNKLNWVYCDSCDKNIKEKQ